MRTIPLSGIKKIEEMAARDPNCISLSQGALRTGGIPQKIKQHVQHLLDTTLTDYYSSSAGLAELREALAQTHSYDQANSISAGAATLTTLSHQHVRVGNILPTHGCIGGLSLIFLALLKPEDEVIIPEPAYPAYYTLSLTARAKPVFVSVKTDTGWELNIDDIKRATTEKTRIIIFSNPWNPLGIVVPESTIEELVHWCEERGIYLIVDEAYREYVFSNKQLPNIISRAITSTHVISTHSFSKNFAMSGWRVGYVIAHETIIPRLVTIQDALLNSLNNTGMHAALYATRHPELTTPFKAIVSHNQKLAYDWLKPLIDRNIITTHKPDGGFFYFIQTPHHDPTQLCMELLTKAGVSLVPGPTFGPSAMQHIRLCFARDTAVLEEGIARFVSYLLTCESNHV